MKDKKKKTLQQTPTKDIRGELGIGFLANRRVLTAEEKASKAMEQIGCKVLERESSIAISISQSGKERE